MIFERNTSDESTIARSFMGNNILFSGVNSDINSLSHKRDIICTIDNSPEYRQCIAQLADFGLLEFIGYRDASWSTSPLSDRIYRLTAKAYKYMD